MATSEPAPSALREKKLSSSSLAAADASRPKVVTVKMAESNKAKPTSTKKARPVQSDIDLSKEFTRCREEGTKRLDLSKSNVRTAITASTFPSPCFAF